MVVVVWEKTGIPEEKNPPKKTPKILQFLQSRLIMVLTSSFEKSDKVEV